MTPYPRTLSALALAAAVALAPVGASNATQPVEAPLALRIAPPKAHRTRPLVAIVADNQGAELTDFVVPFGVLKESGAVDVTTLSLTSGPVQLMPALSVQADRTVAAFDAQDPEGADIIVVPAMHRQDNPQLLGWLQAQSAKGATIVSICDGAWVLARAGLLHNRRAAVHWYSLGAIARAFPDTTWVRDRRYVADGAVMTTTGVTASIPASLALVEVIAGREAARRTADRLGVHDWSAAHDTARFHLGATSFWTIAANTVAVLGHETVSIPVEEGVDEVSLALTADAWSRTWKSQAVATRTGGPGAGAAIRSLHGLVLLPTAPAQGLRVEVTKETPGRALDDALAGIERRYGAATRAVVAVTMEYPQP